MAHNRPQILIKVDVRFGSKADMCGAKRHVRFTPKSRHPMKWQRPRSSLVACRPNFTAGIRPARSQSLRPLAYAMRRDFSQRKISRDGGHSGAASNPIGLSVRQYSFAL